MIPGEHDLQTIASLILGPDDAAMAARYIARRHSGHELTLFTCQLGLCGGCVLCEVAA